MLIYSGCATESSIPPPVQVPESKTGGKIRVGISDPISIDPSNASDESSALIVRTMCDPLIQLDTVTGALSPAIAESWIISDGGRRFTVKLRKGVRFTDGQELTAEDVVFSLSRVAREETASPLGRLLSPIQGYEEFRQREQQDTERPSETLRGLRVVAKNAFEINLKQGNADYIRLLAHPLASPVSKKAFGKDPARFPERPVCSGPYRPAASWRPGDPIILLRRFPSYRPVNEGLAANGMGLASEIEFRVMPDAATELVEFKKETLEVAHLPRSAIGESAQFADKLIQAPGGGLEYIALPIGKEPFNRPGVRRALSAALDRSAVVRSALGGLATPALGYLPPTLGPEYRKNTCGRSTPPTPRVDTARELLAVAGISLEGRAMNLYFNDEFGNRELMEEVGRQWGAAFGLLPQLVPSEWAPYITRARERGFDGPFRMSWIPPYLGSDGYLGALFHSTNPENFSGFNSQDFDRILERVARRQASTSGRDADYRQLEDLVCNQMPVIPIGFGLQNHLVNRSRIGNLDGRPMADRSTGDVELRGLFLR